MPYQDDYHKIYTDGSAYKETRNADCVARMVYEYNNHEEFSELCGAYCSYYKAENLAIISAAVEKHKTSFKTN